MSMALMVVMLFLVYVQSQTHQVVDTKNVQL